MSTQLINPWPIWGMENEDEFGDPVSGPLWIELVEVTAPDGTAWVTCMTRRTVMFRKDVLDLSTVDENHWGFPFKPDSWNLLGERPYPIPSPARFRPVIIRPLLGLGLKVLPLTSDDDHTTPLPHAIMRGEDWIGYVMASRLDEAIPLPDELQVPS